MARSASSDPLLAYNFAVIDIPVPGLLPLAFPGKTILSAIESGSFVGFQGIDMPSFQCEMKEIKEGNWPRIHKINMGFANGGQATLRQAVLPYATDMYYWFAQALWGRVAPRRNLLIAQLRNDKQVPQRLILLEGCVPEMWQPSSNFDATSSEVTTEEITLSVTNIDIVPLPATVGRPNS